LKYSVYRSIQVMEEGRIHSIGEFSVNEIFQRIPSATTQKVAFQNSDTNYIQLKIDSK
jgi:hypothetical protein